MSEMMSRTRTSPPTASKCIVSSAPRNEARIWQLRLSIFDMTARAHSRSRILICKPHSLANHAQTNVLKSEYPLFSLLQVNRVFPCLGKTFQGLLCEKRSRRTAQFPKSRVSTLDVVLESKPFRKCFPRHYQLTCS